ncbi:MAG: hypothetical protein K2M06_08630 [Muribaculaceae bacterium]|nr:hypothetical protein [Muribaculaceae bacterium]
MRETILHISAAFMLLVCGACGSDEPKENPGNEKPVATAGYVDVEILEYAPAPGQFINEMPEFIAGMNASAMLERANRSISNGELVSLGAWGGSIVYKLGKSIANKDGGDFRIVGNSYYSYTVDGVQCGSSEPGIVYVMKDSNGNGRPDDGWYELQGSHSDMAKTASVAYSERQLTDDTFDLYVSGPGSESQHWTSDPEYHPHSYMPLWLTQAELRFDGRMLPANGQKLDNGQYTQECYTGYADSQPNNSSASELDISAARGLNGEPVELDRIDFIKVQTGVLQFNGHLGECSTEVGRIQVL